MLAAVYGLQAIIFILKREFMLVGWLVIYIVSYPVYSFFLPLYSFWRMDDFSWGNTRLVVGEGNNKKVVMAEDEKFDESMIPLKKFSGKFAELLVGACFRLTICVQSMKLRHGKLVLNGPMRLVIRVTVQRKSLVPVHAHLHHDQNHHAVTVRRHSLGTSIEIRT